jgi:hypothetical protein
MHTILPYGRYVPSDGDTGSNDWFDDLEHDIALDDAHTHDGVTSSKLTSTSITAVTHTISTTTDVSDITVGWVLQSSGEYKRRIAMATFFSSLKFAEVKVEIQKFTATSGGVDLYDVIYPTIEQVGESTFDLYVNDLSTAFRAIYTS